MVASGASPNVDALLRRCCLGKTSGGCDGECGHEEHESSPSNVLREPGAFRSSGVLAPSVRRDLTAVSGAAVRPGNSVRILSDGVDSFGAMLDLVRGARREVQFENFIFRADAIGRAFASELSARARAGARVRVLHDPIGSLMGRRPPVDVLFRRSPAEVRMFNVSWPTRETRARGRDHRKLVVADGRQLVAGGICLADPWAGNCIRHCTWRDSAVLVEGPAADAASEAFDRAWEHGRRLVAPTSSVAAPMGRRSNPPAGNVPVRIVTDLGPERRTLAVVERVMDAAEHQVLITSPYFIPPDRVLRALLRARARGVHVKVLIPGKNNHPLAGLVAEERLLPLLEGGVSVFRWNGAMIHAKSLVVDGEWTLIGSSNLDAVSLHRNTELNIEIHGPAVGSAMVRLFRRDRANSTRFHLHDWHDRSRLRRLAGRAVSFLGPRL